MHGSMKPGRCRPRAEESQNIAGRWQIGSGWARMEIVVPTKVEEPMTVWTLL
jgi:hypothetical protein